MTMRKAVPSSCMVAFMLKKHLLKNMVALEEVGAALHFLIQCHPPLSIALKIII